jgi:hypothetical protein
MHWLHSSLSPVSVVAQQRQRCPVERNRSQQARQTASCCQVLQIWQAVPGFQRQAAAKVRRLMSD